MKNPGCKPTQQYISLWKECKAKDEIPKVSMDSADIITSSTTLKEILVRMEKKGIEAESSKEIQSRIITGMSLLLLYYIVIIIIILLLLLLLKYRCRIQKVLGNFK